jgi:membrane-associated phospholipid phosphatase
VHQLDTYLFHLINAWCGGRLPDQIVRFEEGHYAFRALLLIPYWWFWFAGPEERRSQQRQAIVGALLGTLGALVLARGMALMLPFRLRPMYEIGIGYHPPSLQITRTMEDWSSFPSDTAALVFALSFGLWRLSRPLGAALMAYSATWICLPRVYLGIHYPSDILAGALLGIAATWAAVKALGARDGALGRRVMAAVSALEARRPGLFYAAAFAASFEVALLFDDVRAFGRAGLHWLHHSGRAGLGIQATVLLGGGALLALAALAFHARRRPPASVGPWLARRVEIFSAGCPACEEAVALVRSIAGPSCDVEVLDMRRPDVAARARRLGIRSVPSVVVDGRLADCCAGRGCDEASLRRHPPSQPQYQELASG